MRRSKRFILLVSLVACMVLGITGGLVAANPGWQQLESGTEAYLCSVDFPVNATTGYVVGTTEEGKLVILKTTDGGASWENVAPDEWGDLRSVHFPQGNTTGYASGGGSTILKTTDGGSSWVEQTLPTLTHKYVTLFSVYFINNANGYAVGEYGTILKTTDGGNTWIILNSGVEGLERDVTLEAVYFRNATTGWAMGGSDGTERVILKTTDGGTTWVRQPEAEALGKGDFLCMDFAGNTATGFISGHNGTLLKTTDGGETWASINVPEARSALYCIQFPVDTNVGYMTCDNAILKTVDGGATWTRATDFAPSFEEFFGGIDFPTDNMTGYAVGAPGWIFKTTDGCGIAVQEPEPEEPDVSVSPLTASLDFGTVTEGSSSSTETVTVRNYGDADLTIGNVTIGGADADQFAKQNDNCSGQTIEPGASATVEVVFNPTSSGAKTATLSITTNDPDEGTINVTLKGTGEAKPAPVLEVEEEPVEEPEEEVIAPAPIQEEEEEAAPGGGFPTWVIVIIVLAVIAFVVWWRRLYLLLPWWRREEEENKKKQ